MPGCCRETPSSGRGASTDLLRCCKKLNGISFRDLLICDLLEVVTTAELFSPKASAVVELIVRCVLHLADFLSLLNVLNYFLLAQECSICPSLKVYCRSNLQVNIYSYITFKGSLFQHSIHIEHLQKPIVGADALV